MLPVSFSPLAELGLKELVRSGVESFYFRKIIWQVQGGGATQHHAASSKRRAATPWISTSPAKPEVVLKSRGDAEALPGSPRLTVPCP